MINLKIFKVLFKLTDVRIEIVCGDHFYSTAASKISEFVFILHQSKNTLFNASVEMELSMNWDHQRLSNSKSLIITSVVRLVTQISANNLEVKSYCFHYCEPYSFINDEKGKRNYNYVKIYFLEQGCPTSPQWPCRPYTVGVGFQDHPCHATLRHASNGGSDPPSLPYPKAVRVVPTPCGPPAPPLHTPLPSLPSSWAVRRLTEGAPGHILAAHKPLYEQPCFKTYQYFREWFDYILTTCL